MDQQVELEQRLEGIDVDLLHCTKDEASKRVDDSEIALADCRAHVAAAERAYDLATAEQKLLDEKIQVAHAGSPLGRLLSLLPFRLEEAHVRLYAHMESIASHNLAQN